MFSAAAQRPVCASLVLLIQGSAGAPGKAKYWVLTVRGRMSAGECCGRFYEKQPGLPKRDSAMSRQRKTVRFGQTLLRSLVRGRQSAEGQTDTR